MEEQAEKMNRVVKAVADKEGKYLTFTLAGEEYGIDRLAEVALRYRDRPAVALIEELHQDLRRFVGASVQEDDLTALVIKRV